MTTFFSRSKYTLISGLTIALLLGAAVYGITASRTERFEAEVPLVITPNENLVEPSDVNYAEDVLSRQAVTATFAELLAVSELRAEGLALAGIGTNSGSAYEISVAASPGANFVTVAVLGPDPTTAAALADAVANIGVGYFEDLYPVYRATVVQAADVPTEPVGFEPWQLAFIAAVAGAVVGGLAGSRVDDRRRSGAPAVGNR
jgi:capsular polysaccharide biosynthesis protein